MCENNTLPTQKVVLVGDSGVGKSGLVNRLAQNGFDRDSKPTLGAKMVIVLANIGSETKKLRVLDTAGLERYRAPGIPYDGAAGVMLVYDTTRRQTFENITRWLGEVRDHAHKDVNLILVGNKTDLDLSKAVTHEEGSSFARSEGLTFVETSAADGTNVKHAFEALLNVVDAQ